MPQLQMIDSTYTFVVGDTDDRINDRRNIFLKPAKGTSKWLIKRSNGLCSKSHGFYTSRCLSEDPRSTRLLTHQAVPRIRYGFLSETQTLHKTFLVSDITRSHRFVGRVTQRFPEVHRPLSKLKMVLFYGCFFFFAFFSLPRTNAKFLLALVKLTLLVCRTWTN